MSAQGVDGDAWVATKTGDVGSPSLGDGTQLVAVDVSGDGVADASFGPLACDRVVLGVRGARCRRRRIDELLIQNIQFTIAGLRLCTTFGSDPQPDAAPVTVSSRGCPGERLAPGAEPQLWIGGDAFDTDTLAALRGPGRHRRDRAAS